MPVTNLPEAIAGGVAVGITALSVFLADPAAPPSTTAAAPAAAPAAAASMGSGLSAATSSVVAFAGGMHVYWGNLHSHTSYSDGSGTPAEAFTFARDVGHLDFLAITEHNHIEAEAGAEDRADGVMIASSPELYDGPQPASLVSAAESHTVDGKFVALYGQEFSTISRGNHVNVFDVRGVINVPKGEFKQLIDTWLPAHPDSTGTAQLLQFNHAFSKGPADVGEDSDDDSDSGKKARTEYGADDFGSRQAWVAAMDRHAELFEIFNGPGTKDATGLAPDRTVQQYLKYLNLGFHLGPTGDQDNHYRTWGTQTEVRTGGVDPIPRTSC